MTAAAGSTAFPWQLLMRAGLGLLRLSPSVFWTMTPRELEAAFGTMAGRATPPGRSELAAMMARHPDNQPTEGSRGGRSQAQS